MTDIQKALEGLEASARSLFASAEHAGKVSLEIHEKNLSTVREWVAGAEPVIDADQRRGGPRPRFWQLKLKDEEIARLKAEVESITGGAAVLHRDKNAEIAALTTALEEARDKFDLLCNPLQAEHVIEKGWKVLAERGRDGIDKALSPTRETQGEGSEADEWYCDKCDKPQHGEAEHTLGDVAVCFDCWKNVTLHVYLLPEEIEAHPQPDPQCDGSGFLPWRETGKAAVECPGCPKCKPKCDLCEDSGEISTWTRPTGLTVQQQAQGPWKHPCPRGCKKPCECGGSGMVPDIVSTGLTHQPFRTCSKPCPHGCKPKDKSKGGD